MAEPAEQNQVERWISAVGNVIAPTTLLGALLFYFGYVSSRAQYEYFGVDVDTIGLSTRDYVMRSPQPLLVPSLLLTAVGVAAIAAHLTIRARIAEADEEQLVRLRRWARLGMRIGLALLAASAVLVIGYEVVRDWPYYALVTPLLIAVGATLVAYTARIQPRLGAVRRDGDGTAALRRGATALVWALVAASLFWATATVAQWSGRGLARYNAQHLDRYPSVIVDTKERLFLRDPGVEETVLPPSEGQTFHYRYRHLRLLIEGKDRMFLVPDEWSASDSTLVLPLDSVRVQFQFENDPP